MSEVFWIMIYGVERVATLSLPATDYAILDAMSKARICEGDYPTIEINRFADSADGLQAILEDDLNLFELNALAKRISAFQIEDHTAFHALVSEELEKGMKAVPLNRLLDLAYSTDCCDVHPFVSGYEELGHFYVENNLIPELRDIQEQALPMLDYEKIGRDISQKEGGILDPGGYVTQTSDLVKAPKEVRCAPSKPEYIILLELTAGRQKVVLNLPANPSAVDHALKQLNALDWSDIELRCLDCAAPSLTPHIGEGNNIAHINQLAQQLQDFSEQELTKYKAILDATEDYSVIGAAHIADHLDDYLFTPQYATPADMARGFLESSMGKVALNSLLKYIDLAGYGRTLMQEQECTLTEYGLVSREDGQCLKTSLSPTGKPEMGGMRME